MNAEDYIIITDILEEAASLKERGLDLSKIRYTKEKRQSKDYYKFWAEGFDNIRNKLKNSGCDLNIPLTQRVR